MGQVPPLVDSCRTIPSRPQQSWPIVVEAWRSDYHTFRPHSALRYRTPEEFAQRSVRKTPVGLEGPLDLIQGAVHSTARCPRQPIQYHPSPARSPKSCAPAASTA